LQSTARHARFACLEPAGKRSLLKTILYRDTIYKIQRKSIHFAAWKALTLTDYESLAELRYQIRRFVHFSERASRMAGLEPHQHQLMLALKGLPRMVHPRIGELAERLQIRHHSTVELANRLSAGGYIRRHRGGEDRREVWLSLTPKGEKVLRELSLHHRAELRMHGPALIAALRRAIHMSKSSNPVPAKSASRTRRKT
jgi:DNA-binding MarR family transcriptional regulator